MRRQYLKTFFSYPLSIAASKSLDLIRKKSLSFIQKQWYRQRSSYCQKLPFTLKKPYSYIDKLTLDEHFECKETVRELSKRCLEHRFDLLGSGWVSIKHNMKCPGLLGVRYEQRKTVDPDVNGAWLTSRLNRANLQEGKRIWKLIYKGKSELYTEYVTIDWQRDFKSGYRWKESCWYQDVPYGHMPAVDVKLPWELARMQHLGQIALAYGFSKINNRGRFLSPESYMQEFRNQLLDFIVTNPPKYGVNWRCTMDVAIRVANWLIAYDLFVSFGASFDREFEAIFIRSIYEHALHIVGNLEWSKEKRNNHYLSDVVGLLFASAYLPRSDLTDAWLAFSIQELINETAKQFHNDGSNYEASTSYHRLSSELVVFGAALVLGLPKDKKRALDSYNHKLVRTLPKLKHAPLPSYPVPRVGEIKRSPFPKWFFYRLEKMAEFTMDVSKPDGQIPQIGDNDSGRLFKLMPSVTRLSPENAKERYANLEGLEIRDDYLDENILDHRHLVGEISGFFERQDFLTFSGSNSLDRSIIRNLSNNLTLKSRKDREESDSVGSEQIWDAISEKIQALPGNKKQKSVVLISEINISANILNRTMYTKFGVYIFKSQDLYLCVRCCQYPVRESIGHSHCDNLSLELWCSGKDLITDPGSFLYTPFPEIRNEYRSKYSHSVPSVGSDHEKKLDRGLFWLVHTESVDCHYFGQRGFIGSIRGEKREIYRLIKIELNRLTIVDALVKGEGRLNPPLCVNQRVSNGYGKQLKQEALNID